MPDRIMKKTRDSLTKVTDEGVWVNVSRWIRSGWISLKEGVRERLAGWRR